ncbi:hypothetical protein CIRMBP1196_01765 [Enterococcus cecorum]|uniref:DUF2513 domain-containing protein n=1 Tax=Enterococcus cecorum TaxID=44008 RepID=UPI00148B96A6|nr:DUF2513 domain-containing protein [Enterococcus cecorum]CAI3295799.1 hypothetical protein CIRMBP1195_00451 [Enterococcus cecorum]CAI3374686.1 hypothetical protein CIRMBP1319_00668 [Enterococcus cecorum]CAI3453657.1 hypothetical protein CIRMBP1196_01765 [Enterococcus cecorum]
MKLSPDCIRDILLFAEELPFTHTARNDEIFKSKLLEQYTEDEINYAIRKLGNHDANLIIGDVQFASNIPYMTYISGLTFNGHQYLENIKDPTVWEKTKEATSKFTSVSIDILGTVAASVITKMLHLD